MKTSGRLFLKWLANIFIAPITVAKASTRLDNGVASANGEEEKKWWPLAVATSFFFYGFVVFHFAQLGSQGMWAIAWVMYITYTGIVTSIRIKVSIFFEHLMPFHELSKINIYSCSLLLQFPEFLVGKFEVH